MVLWIFVWILLTDFAQRTTPEFVVRETEACCHHRISLQCRNQNFKIAIVQARYVIDPDPGLPAPVVSAAASIDSSAPRPSPEYDEEEEEHHHAFISPSQRSVSLWDLDVKFLHQLQREGLHGPSPVNTLPEWHPDHISNAAIRRQFYKPRPTIPPQFPSGSNFSIDKVMEIPFLYENQFFDMTTFWRQALFPIIQSESSESSSFLFSKYFSVFPNPLPHKPEKCLSYQTLMNAARRASVYSGNVNKETASGFENKRPRWHYKDLRMFFNARCSGKSECDVILLRQGSNGIDEEIAQLCTEIPDGKIIVKYICFDEEKSNAKCNVDVRPAKEGFLMNPAYPDIYPGDQPCEIRLHAPQQKILLIFLDISLRAKDKRRCRDVLEVTESLQYKLLSTCGDQSTAIALLSETHEVNITLIPQSRLAFPKRGFLAYYRVIGCVDPTPIRNSYLSLRNATMAKIVCEVGHVFPDSLSRVRWLYCSPLDHRWLGGFPFCSDIRNFEGRNVSIEQLLQRDPSVWPVRFRTKDHVYYSEVVLPVFVIMMIFGIHGFILFLIWRQRSRLEEIENQTNLEMERICRADADEDGEEAGSMFSFFPDSFMEDLWDQDNELEETDQDRTLTTLTLQTSTPNSSEARKMMDFSHSEERNGHFRFYQNGTSVSVNVSAIGNGNGSANGGGRNGYGPNSRHHIKYTPGEVLPVAFNGYFRQTAV